MQLPPIVHSVAEVRQRVWEARKAGKKIALVPTMGALHAGHAALIRAARLESEFVIVTIFVNPIQFNNAGDLERYPRTLEDDQKLCAAVGTDLIFAPTAESMYPAGFCTSVEVAQLGDHLCGPSRPGHFRGVTTVVAKLFNIALADLAFFGQKDAQQARIIEQMTRDLDFLTQIRIIPTIREADGLAMSSRNRFLDPVQRSHATVIYRTLKAIEEKVRNGERNVGTLEAFMEQQIRSTPGATLDYARIVDAQYLQPIETIQGPALVAMAVFFGTTRLIDNLPLDL